MIEVWDPDTKELPENDGRLGYETMSDTDFFELTSKETYALALEFSKSG